MSEDLSQYQAVIDKLKPIIRDENFETMFLELTPGLSKPARFLIKMELKRLATPCQRLIDLRGLVDGECDEYKDGTRIHYLDDVARTVYEQQKRVFNGYTMGVYDATMNTENNFRVMHKQEQQRRLNPTAEQKKDKEPRTVANTGMIAGSAIRFAQYQIRHEERMNFVSQVEIELDNGTRIAGKSSDVSVSGAKVKVDKDAPIAIGDELSVYLRGLEQEFTLDPEKGLRCTVLGVRPSDNNQQAIRLKRIDNANNEALSEFLQRFIHGNKRRYKVNLNNTLEAVETKTLEQFYLPRILSLPIFLQEKDGVLRPEFVLTTENNRDTLAYWRDESQVLQLPSIVTPERMAHLNAQPQRDRHCYMYSFSHVVNEKTYYFTACDFELAESEKLCSLFIGFASSKPSWRVFKLQLTDCSSEDAHIPLSIPNSAGDAVKQFNKPPSPRVMSLLNPLRHILVMTDVTGKDISNFAKEHKYERKQVNALNRFRLVKNTDIKLTEVGLAFINLRRESRFVYQSLAHISIGDYAHVPAMIKNFSVKGIQVELENAMSNIKLGEIVSVQLTDFQKLSSQFRLEHLDYEVMRFSNEKTILHLRAKESTTAHQGKKFFRQLIEKNRSKLAKAEESSKIPGLSSALRNMYCKNMLSTPWFVDRSGARYFIERVGICHRYVHFQQLLGKFTQKSQLNLFPLLGSREHSDEIGENLKSMTRESLPLHQDIYVFINVNKTKPQQAVTVKFRHEFEDSSQLTFFVKHACQHGLFFCMRLYMSRTGRPDLDFITNELGYISQYAIHRAKKIEEKIWSVVGIGDMIDVSGMAMTAQKMTADDILQQEQAKFDYLADVVLP